MDLIMGVCLEVIYLSGLRGIDPRSLFEKVSEAGPFVLDSYQREWLWRQVLKCAFSFVPERYRIRAYWTNKKAPVVISSSSDLFGLCPSERREADLREYHLPLAEVAGRSEEELRLVGSGVARSEVLGFKGSKVDISPISYAVLEVVGSSGRGGILQTELASQLSFDSRTLFHHLRKLVNLSLVTRRSVYLNRPNSAPMHTNLILLGRESPKPEKLNATTAPRIVDGSASEDEEDDEQQSYGGISDRVLLYDDMIMRIVNFLKAAKNHLLSESELKGHVDRMTIGHQSIWGILKRILVEQRVIQSVNATFGSGTAPVKCIVLLRVPSDSSELEQCFKKLATGAVTRPQIPILFEYLIDYQIFKAIEASGDNGLVQATLNMRGYNGRLINKKCNILRVKRRLISSVSYSVNAGKNASFLLKSVLPPSATHFPQPDVVVDGSAPSSNDVAMEGDGLQHPGSNSFKITVQHRRRRSFIHNLLMERGILIMSSIRSLIRTFDREFSDESNNQGKVDHKTIRRIVISMCNDGLGRVITTNVRIGQTLKKVEVLVRKDLSDSEWKELLLGLDEKDFMPKPLAPSVDEVKIKAPASDPPPLISLPAADDKASPPPSQSKGGTSKAWNIGYAVQLGFERALLIRVRILHVYLCSSLWEGAGLIEEHLQKMEESKFVPSSSRQKEQINHFLKACFSSKMAPFDEGRRSSREVVPACTGAAPDLENDRGDFTATDDNLPLQASQETWNKARELWARGPSFQVEEMILDMPLIVYCKCLGIFREIPELASTLRLNPFICIRELEPRICAQLTLRSQYSRSFKKLLECLKQLNLVFPRIVIEPGLNALEGGGLLTLNQVGIIWASGPPETRFVAFLDDRRGLNDYWEVLKYVSRMGSENNNLPRLRIFPSGPGLPSVVFSHVSWTGASVYKNKGLMRELVSRVRQQAMDGDTSVSLESLLDSTSFVQKLALEFGLAFDDVRSVLRNMAEDGTGEPSSVTAAVECAEGAEAKKESERASATASLATMHLSHVDVYRRRKLLSMIEDREIEQDEISGGQRPRARRVNRFSDREFNDLLEAFIGQKASARAFLDDTSTLWDGVDKEELVRSVNIPMSIVEKRLKMILSTKAGAYQLSQAVSRAIWNSMDQDGEAGEQDVDSFTLPDSIVWFREHYELTYSKSRLNTFAGFRTRSSSFSLECTANDDLTGVTKALHVDNAPDFAGLDSICIPPPMDHFDGETTAFLNLAALPQVHHLSLWYREPKYDLVLADYFKSILLFCNSQNIDQSNMVEIFTIGFTEEETAKCFNALRSNRVLKFHKATSGSKKSFHLGHKVVSKLQEAQGLFELVSEMHDLRSKLKSLRRSFSDEGFTGRDVVLRCTNFGKSTPLTRRMTAADDSFVLDSFDSGGYVAEILEGLCRRAYRLESQVVGLEERSTPVNKVYHHHPPKEPQIRIKVSLLKEFDEWNYCEHGNYDHEESPCQIPSPSSVDDRISIGLNDFTAFCRAIGDTEERILHCHRIHQLIEEAGGDSIDMLHLANRIILEDSLCPHVELTRVIEDASHAINRLEMAGLITRVLGPFDESWVAGDRLAKWTVKTRETRVQVLFLPWVMLDGHFDFTVLRKLKAILATIIVSQPGISEELLLLKFEFFRPAIARELLRLMEVEGLLSTKYIRLQRIHQGLQTDIDVLPATNEEYMHYLYQLFFEKSTTHIQKCFWPCTDVFSRL